MHSNFLTFAFLVTNVAAIWEGSGQIAVYDTSLDETYGCLAISDDGEDAYWVKSDDPNGGCTTFQTGASVDGKYSLTPFLSLSHS
jgi:hypothetical protein